MSDIASPLRSIIERLAQTHVDGPAAKIAKRFEGATDTVAVLCDCSGSMCDLVGSFGMSKFQHLQIALEDLALGLPKMRLIAFASRAKQVKSAAELIALDPAKPASACLGGGTLISPALKLAAKWKPRKTIIVSDGLPQDESDSMLAARDITGTVEAIYCGPDDHPAVRFLHGLCKQTGGAAVAWDGRAEISGVFRKLLEAPE